MIFHQSMLAAAGRCLAQFGYERAGRPRQQTSAVAYGSVMHYALLVFEHARATGTPLSEALQQALNTFVTYWNPLHIEAICDPVSPDGWMPRQSYGELRQRGIEALRKYADLIRFDDHELLGLEYPFIVPIDGTWDDELGEPHMLAGSIDRLAIRHYSRKPAVEIADYKTGKEYVSLRWNIQFTAYAYATTKREFWTGYRDEEGFGDERGEIMYQRCKEMGRRGTWINMRLFKMVDAGWRGPQDYDRFVLAVTQLAMAIEADIYPLTITGETCRFCEYRGICGGIGIAAEDHGKPN